MDGWNTTFLFGMPILPHLQGVLLLIFGHELRSGLPPRVIGVGFKPNSPKEEPGNSNAVRSLSKSGRFAASCSDVSCWVCLVGDTETNQ